MTWYVIISYNTAYIFRNPFKRLIAPCHTTDGVYYLEGVNIHGNQISWYLSVTQLLFKALVIVASGHCIHIRYTLKLSLLLRAYIRKARYHLVQLSHARHIDKLGSAILYLSIPHDAVIMLIGILYQKLPAQIINWCLWKHVKLILL